MKAWLYFMCLLQIALAATAIAMIRARVMVDLYFGYYCAFQLDDRQMCTPTIGVASTSLVLSALVAFLSLCLSDASGLCAGLQLGGFLMWLGFAIAAVVGLTQTDNPLDDYLEAQSGAKAVVIVSFSAVVAFLAGCGLAAAED